MIITRFLIDDRLCILVKNEGYTPILSHWYCGYVESKILTENDYAVEAITFTGNLVHIEPLYTQRFVGFDTAHVGPQPSEDIAIKRLKKFAKKVIKLEAKLFM